MATQTSKSANFSDETPMQYLHGLYEVSTKPKHPLGTIRRLSDGRAFIYARVGGANVAPGYLCQGAVHSANFANLNVATNAVIGERVAKVTTGTQAVAANQFADGYLHINTPAANGAGYCYKIKSHAAAAANATLTLNLYDAVRANISSAASKATIIGHPAADFVVHPSPPTQALLGVTVVPANVGEYCWLQRRGPVPIVVDGTIAAGQIVAPSTAVVGAVSPALANAVDAVKQQQVGAVLTVNANAQWALVDLRL